MATNKTFGKGKVLHYQAREIIANVVFFMKQEAHHFHTNKEPLIPILNYKRRIIAATGISEKMYKTVVKESKAVDSGPSTSLAPLRRVDTVKDKPAEDVDASIDPLLLQKPKEPPRNFFKREEVFQFLYGAPSEQYLLEKTVLVMGIFGACSTSELINMKVDDVDDRGSVLVVTLPKPISKKPRTFTVINQLDMKPIDIYRKYLRLRPKHVPHKRLFLNYKNGKCAVQPIGLQKIAKIPGVIAKFLGLEPSSYTGESFQRSSVSLWATDCGAQQVELETNDSNTVEENYVEDYVEEKIDIDEISVKAEYLKSLGTSTSESGVRPDKSTSTISSQVKVESVDLSNVKLEPFDMEEDSCY